MAKMDFPDIVTLDKKLLDESIAAINNRINHIMRYNGSSEIDQALKRASQPMLIRAVSNAMALHKGVSKTSKGKYMKPRNIMQKIAKSLKCYIQKTKRRKGFHKVRVAINRNSRYMKDFVYIAKTKRSKYKGGRTYLPAAIEYGHIAPNGKIVPAMPFMRPAIAQAQQEVVYAFANELKTGLQNAVNKIALKLKAA